MEKTPNFEITSFRHAESLWNEYAYKIMYQSPLKKLNPELEIQKSGYKPEKVCMDPGLTENGIKQAQDASADLLKKLKKIDTILLSPMRRTHQTLYYSLKHLIDTNQINKEEIPKIVCCPFVMPAVKSMVDIPIRLEESKLMMKEFNVDYSMVEKYGDSKVWALEYLKDFAKNCDQIVFIEKALKLYKKSDNSLPVLFDFIIESYPDLIDNSSMKKRRIMAFNKYLKKNFESGKVLFVSHCVFIMNFAYFNKIRLQRVANASLITFLV